MRVISEMVQHQYTSVGGGYSTRRAASESTLLDRRL